nr:MAG TPA: hypothetical protein [Caudoviricetes sp.]
MKKLSLLIKKGWPSGFLFVKALLRATITTCLQVGVNT